MTEEERERKLKEMAEDAKAREQERLQRMSDQQRKDVVDEAGSAATGAVRMVEGEKPQFLDQVHRQTYTATEENLEDRLRRNKHFIEKRAVEG